MTLSRSQISHKTSDFFFNLFIMYYVRVGLHGPGWLYVLGILPWGDVPLWTPRARATDLGPKLEYGVRAGSRCATEPRARGKTPGQKREKCRRMKKADLFERSEFLIATCREKKTDRLSGCPDVRLILVLVWKNCLGFSIGYQRAPGWF